MECHRATEQRQPERTRRMADVARRISGQINLMAEPSTDSNVLDTECAIREGYLAILKTLLGRRCRWCEDAYMWISKQSEMKMHTTTDTMTSQSASMKHVYPITNLHVDVFRKPSRNFLSITSPAGHRTRDSNFHNLSGRLAL